MATSFIYINGLKKSPSLQLRTFIYCKTILVAATSLLKWAREEGNPYLRSMVEKLYNITLMSATVQRQYAEQVLFNFALSLLHLALVYFIVP